MHLLLKQALPHISPDWQPLLIKAFAQMDPAYLDNLMQAQEWLPGMSRFLAAFSLPLKATQYVLLGESPYPRAESANGYAFWDNAVGDLWLPSGFSKAVNRATSLRNIMKMLLHARGDLQYDFSQPAIARLDKKIYWQTAAEFFQNMMQQGFLLLNATLVYRDMAVAFDAKHWRPFLQSILQQLRDADITWVLLGRFAAMAAAEQGCPYVSFEHPYNISFVTNPEVLSFFQPFDLLRRRG